MNNINKRLLALVCAGITLVSSVGFTSCKKQATSEEKTKQETVIDNENLIKNQVNNLSSKIEKDIKLSKDVSYNSSIMLLLDLIAAKDENDKISAEEISKLKSRIDVDNMIDEFNIFLDTIQSNIIMNDKFYSVSEILPVELKTDKKILSIIEKIVANISKYKKENNKEALLKEFNTLYQLFVEEKELKVDGLTFEIRDLSYTSRAVANMYAESALNISRNYITEEEYSRMDKRLNDQNNKAYIKTTLEILSNQMEEKSEIDIVSIMNKKYNEIKKYLNGKVNISDETIRNLVNYANMKYLSSDKVSTKDKNIIIGQFDVSSDTDLAIAAINKYNLTHNDSILYSSLLIDEYIKVYGETDVIALNFVQFNTIMLLDTVNDDMTFNELRNNPYFENIFKYFTKQNFTFIDGNDKSHDIAWQEVADGVNYINNVTILNTLNSLSNVENLDNYKEKVESNLHESVQYLQNIITGECKKTEEFVKQK